jgi:hypothetical protein
MESAPAIMPVPYTAFAVKKAHRVTARLIVRRVRRLAPPAQGELLPAWHHHAIFTDSPLPLLAAETDHRDHCSTASPSCLPNPPRSRRCRSSPTPGVVCGRRHRR